MLLILGIIAAIAAFFVWRSASSKMGKNRKEKREVDRKRSEAEGIADFQDFFAAGIRAQLLRSKGFESTEEIARSPNTTR